MAGIDDLPPPEEYVQRFDRRTERITYRMEYSENEDERITALRLYRILDTAAERAYDDLTQLAAAVCGTEISLVSFVDGDRQWFKAKTGMTISETPREHSFCSHAILEEDITIVEDPSQDARFVDNPLVLGEPRIRFYAAAPLRVRGGAQQGTLCVIDSKPRKLSLAQRKALGVLRDAVVTQIECRRIAEDVKALESLLPICAWCRNVKVEGEGKEVWVPLHEYLSGLQNVTHGACPRCQDDVVLGHE